MSFLRKMATGDVSSFLKADSFCYFLALTLIFIITELQLKSIGMRQLLSAIMLFQQ